MAANDTAALVVALSAQISQFEKDMDKASDLADRHVREIEAKFSASNISFPGLDGLIGKVKTLAGGGAIGLVIQQFHELNAEVAKIGEVAQTVGLTTDEFQKLRFAIVATGGSVQAADTFVERFARSSAEAATGTGNLYNFLRANNIAAAQFVKLPLVDQIARYADLVKNTANPQERLNEAFIVAGRQAGPQVVQALSAGADGLRRFGDEATRSGAIIDRDLVERARKINTEFEKLKLTIGVTTGEIAVSTWDLLARSISNVASSLAEFTSQFDALKRLREGLGGSSDISGIGENVPGVGFVPGSFSGTRPNVTISKPSEPVPLPPSRPDNIGDGSTRQFNVQADAFDKLVKAQERRIALLDAEKESVGQSAAVEAFLKTQLDLTNQAIEQNIPLTAERKNQITQEAIKTAEAAQKLDDYKRQWQSINQAAQFAGDQLIDVLTGLETRTLSLSDAAKQLESSLIRALNQAAILGTGPLAGLFGTASNVQGGTGGLIGALLGGISGKRAGGGPVSQGGIYLVGENGPELFSPGSSGNIIPNGVTGRAAGGSAATVQINNYAAGDTETKQSTRSTPDGEMVVIDIVKKGMAAGAFDSINRARYGTRAQKRR